MKSITKAISQRKREEKARETATMIWNIAQKEVYLRFFHFLRFWHKTRFKKRLGDFIVDFGVISEQTHELDKDHIKIAVMLKELNDSGIDFGDFFDELVAYEEAQYDISKMQEYGKRSAGK